MDFPALISRTSQFPILGVLGGIFHCYSNFNRTFCKQTVETLIRPHRMTPYSAASDLGPQCLPMSHKKDAMLIWVKEAAKIRKFCLLQILVDTFLGLKLLQ